MYLMSHEKKYGKLCVNILVTGTRSDKMCFNTIFTPRIKVLDQWLQSGCMGRWSHSMSNVLFRFQWIVPQLSIRINYNGTWSILIQWLIGLW